MFDFLKPVVKTDKELQAELKALVKRMCVDQYQMPSDLDRYENMLSEIYKRGLEPEKELVIIKKK